MLTYSLLLHGLDGRPGGEGLPGALVRDLLDAVDRGARGAVRLRLEGRSRAKGGFDPEWVHRAARFDMAGLLPGRAGIELRAPTLREALPERFEQQDLFLPVSPADSAITLMGRSLEDALAGEADSDVYDEPLLHTFEEFRRVFRHGVEALEIRNGRADSVPVSVTPQGIEVVRRLKRETPSPRRVRIAGKVDAIRYSDRAFTLVLHTGEELRGVLTEGEPEDLAGCFGRTTIVSGMAHYRPSGALLRVEAEQLAPGTEDDLKMWASVPAPLDFQPDLRAARRPQTPRTGINAIIGKWPGDETDEEIFRLLEEMS